jgi:hypothetical protein
VREVGVYSVRGDEELSADVTIGVPVGDKFCDLDLGTG